jgi:hypothetical protein
MRSLLLLLGWCWLSTVGAQEIRVLVQSSPLAGSQYHALDELWDALRVGSVLQLVREPDNPYDAHAVRVEWRGRLLGYVPRAENRSVAAALDAGEHLEARVAKLRQQRNPWQRLEMEILLRL